MEIGEIYNNWKIIDIISDAECLCECQCSKHTVKSVSTYNLITGRSKSCGCTRYNRKDLVGEYFGDWEVTKMLPNKKVLCKCKCGVEKEQYLSNLLRATSEYKCRHIGEVGKQYGNWIVLKELGGGKVLCQCQCENKTTKELYKKAVISGQTRSCGCLSKQFERESKGYKDLTGSKFGEWTVLKFCGNSTWLCECSCSNHTQRLVTTEALINGRSKSCGCKQGEHIKDTIQTVYNGIYPQNVEYNSKVQSEIYDYIKEICSYKVDKGRRDVISPYELDIYIPEKRIAFEVNGTYWHSELFKEKQYHQKKTLLCLSQNIRLIHIFEYEWTNNNEIIKSFINDTIGNSKVLYARDTEICINGGSECIQFIRDNHLQGYTESSINIELKYNNEIVAAMTFGRPRFNNNYQYELIRLCYKQGIKIVGGAEKLFKAFVSKYNPDSIITYCNISKFKGDVYSRLGFSMDSITEPNYVWEKGNTVYTRYQTQKKRLISKGIGNPDMTEDEIMHSIGFNKIYDCGNIKFIWNKEAI